MLRGLLSRTWRKQLGGRPLVVGWGRPVTIDRAVEFLTPDEETETDLDDLIARYMLIDTPVPGEGGTRFSPHTPAASAGRAGDLPKRMESVVTLLRAEHQASEHGMKVRVPLHEGRRQVADVFILDGHSPYTEGEPMLGVESDVGEISNVVDPPMLLAGLSVQPYARVVLVKSDKEMPRIVVQGFLPLARSRDQDLAALVYQVASLRRHPRVAHLRRRLELTTFPSSESSEAANCCLRPSAVEAMTCRGSSNSSMSIVASWVV